MADEKRLNEQYEPRKRWPVVVAVIITAIIAFSVGYFPFHTSPTSQQTSTVNIQFYESVATSEQAFIEKTLIPQFESQYPNIKVTFVNFGSEGVSQNILALEQSGDVGSIVAGQDNLEIGSLIYSSQGNVLMNLTSASSSLMPSTMIPAARNLVNYEKQVFGGVYFFPFRGNVPLVFYNKTMFQSAGISNPPSTDAQLLQDAAMIYNKTHQKAVMIQGASTSSGHSGSSTATELYQWMVQYGGNPLYLNDSGDLHAMQFIYNLSAYFSPSFTGGYWGSYAGLYHGNYSVLDYQWPYIYNILTASPYNMTNSSLGVYPGPAGPVNGNHLMGGDVLFIPKGATNVPSLETFIKFLLSTQAQRETLLNLSWVAINSAAYQNLPAKYSAIDTALGNAIETGVFLRNPTPWITEWQVILDNTVFNPVFVQKSSGYSDLPTLLSNAHTAMYQYILKNYGSTNATLYQSDSNYAPISV
jgi:trehalose transport system substrate-binding protein